MPYTTLTWVAAVLLEAVAVALAVYSVPVVSLWVWFVLFFCHLGAGAVVLAFGFFPVQEMTNSRYRARLFGLLILFLPGLGLIGSVFLQLACGRLIKSHGLIDEFHDEADHRVLDPKSMHVKQDITAYFDQELAVQPVTDIMSGHDDDLKRGAINTLQQIRTPVAISILKKSLTDASPEIRHYAHIALTRLDETYVEAIKEVQKIIDTSDPQTGDHLKHAHLCIEYASSGLLDQDTRRHYLETARTAYQAAQGGAAPDMEQMQSLGHLELQMGDFDLALSHFQAILAQSPNNIAALMGLAEVYFIKKDTIQLQAVVRRMQNTGTTDEASTEHGILFQFWTVLPEEA